VCLRTFSKIYGLASLRIGYGYASAELCALLNRVRQPFNVNALAQAAALTALADSAYVEESHRLNQEGMKMLEEGLAARGIGFVPSRGNFLLVKVGDGGKIYERLGAQGGIVRPVANYGLPEYLRVTIGLPAENRRFLAALEAALAG
jgi:histidinol-phosphate aminotransferase